MRKPKVKVHLWSALRSRAEGQEVVELEACTIGQMLDALVRAYPELEELVDAGVSVAVDGRIIASDLTEPLNETSEIYLMQRLRGG